MATLSREGQFDLRRGHCHLSLDQVTVGGAEERGGQTMSQRVLSLLWLSRGCRVSPTILARFVYLFSFFYL